MRSFWDGNLQLGLVSIPVGLASTRAIQSTGLTRVHRECGAKVDSRGWCAVDERLVEDDETVKAFEIAAGQHVTIEDDELAAIEPPETRTIDVLATINRGLLDELQVDAAYYLMPARTPVGRRPYELFRRALAARPSDGLLCRLVVRKNEWVALVRAHPTRRTLLLEKLVPEGVMLDPGEIEQQLTDITVSDQELELATELLLKNVRLRVPKGALKISQRERLIDLVERKLAGERILHEPRPTEPADPQGEVPAGADLVSALRRSLGRQTKQKPRPRPAAVKR